MVTQYQTRLHSITDKSTLLKKKVSEKMEYFQFLATDQGQEWQYWQYAEDLKTEDSTLLGLD